MLFACRALFGIGMGGEWSAGMALTLEHWARPLAWNCLGPAARGLWMGVHPVGGRVHLCVPAARGLRRAGVAIDALAGIVPAFLVFWIRSRVAESPVWLERQLHLRKHPIREETSVLRIFRRGIVRTTLQTSLLMASLMFSFYSLTYWYATFLREAGRTTLGLDHRRAAPGNCGSVAWTRDERTSAGRDRSVRGNRRFAGKDAVVAH